MVVSSLDVLSVATESNDKSFPYYRLSLNTWIKHWHTIGRSSIIRSPGPYHGINILISQTTVSHITASGIYIRKWIPTGSSRIEGYWLKAKSIKTTVRSGGFTIKKLIYAIIAIWSTKSPSNPIPNKRELNCNAKTLSSFVLTSPHMTAKPTPTSSSSSPNIFILPKATSKS